jgi:hypothetical protein
MKKTEGRKSRDTVPLTLLFPSHHHGKENPQKYRNNPLYRTGIFLIMWILTVISLQTQGNLMHKIKS